MISYLLSLPSIWTLLSITAVFIAYEHLLQATKKTSLARVHSQLAEERACAAERDARTAREGCEAVGRHLIALEERIAEQQLFLCAVVEGRFPVGANGGVAAQQLRDNQQHPEKQQQQQQQQQQPPQPQKRRQSAGIDANGHAKDPLSRFTKGGRHRGRSYGGVGGGRQMSEVLGRSSFPPLQGSEGNGNGRTEARFFSLNNLPSMRPSVPLYAMGSAGSADSTANLMSPNGSRRKKYASSRASSGGINHSTTIPYMHYHNNIKSAFDCDGGLVPPQRPASLTPTPVTDATTAGQTAAGTTLSARRGSTAALDWHGAACVLGSIGRDRTRSDAGNVAPDSSHSAPTSASAPAATTTTASGSNIARIKLVIANNIKELKSKFKIQKNQSDISQQQSPVQKKQSPQRSSSSNSLSNTPRKKMMLLTF